MLVTKALCVCRNWCQHTLKCTVVDRHQERQAGREVKDKREARSTRLKNECLSAGLKRRHRKKTSLAVDEFRKGTLNGNIYGMFLGEGLRRQSPCKTCPSL